MSNKLRFKAPIEGNHGWFCCTLGSQTLYLHTDGQLRGSTRNDEYPTDSSGYFDDEQHAMDTLVEYIANHMADY